MLMDIIRIADLDKVKSILFYMMTQKRKPEETDGSVESAEYRKFDIESVTFNPGNLTYDITYHFYHREDHEELARYLRGETDEEPLVSGSYRRSVYLDSLEKALKACWLISKKDNASVYNAYCKGELYVVEYVTDKEEGIVITEEELDSICLDAPETTAICTTKDRAGSEVYDAIVLRILSDVKAVKHSVKNDQVMAVANDLAWAAYVGTTMANPGPSSKIRSIAEDTLVCPENHIIYNL